MTTLIIFALIMLAIGIVVVVAILIDTGISKDSPNPISFLHNKLSILNADDAATLLNEGQLKEYEVGSVRFYKKTLSEGKRVIIRSPRSDEYRHIPCPVCKFMTAYCIKGSITIERDYGKAGEFQRSYECKHCGYAYRTVHLTPPIVQWTSLSSGASTQSPQKGTSNEGSMNTGDDLILGATIGYIAAETSNDD